MSISNRWIRSSAGMGKPGQKLAKANRSISLRIPGPARRSSGNRPTIAIAHQQKRNDRPMTGHLLDDLNPGQTKAVTHLDVPAVILADPGAAKTISDWIQVG